MESRPTEKKAPDALCDGGYVWHHLWYHTYMSTKTTIYLSDDLKRAVEREARKLGTSEAEVIRSAISAHVKRPDPQPGLFAAEPMAERADELLAGFGDR